MDERPPSFYLGKRIGNKQLKRKMRKIVAAICVSVLLFSCGDIQEELVINQDDSGYYSISYDMVKGMTSMTKMMTMAFSESEGKKMNEDSLDQVLREKIWEDFPNEVDSFIDMTESFEEKGYKGEELERMKNAFQIFMKGKKEDEQLDMGLRINFQNLEELQDLWSLMDGFGEDRELMSKVGPGVGSMFGGMNKSDSAPFIFSENGIVKPSFASSEKEEKSKGKSDKEFEDLMKDSTYSILIKTAKDIKKVKGKGVKLIDKNTVQVEYAVLDFMKNSSKTGFEIFYEE